MAQTNYQEPIEGKDVDLEKKLREAKIESENKELTEKPREPEKKEILPMPEAVGEITGETGTEAPEEKISEKIETARQTISVQPAAPALNVANDAQSVSQIQEFEKKVEKLVEIAVQKGPEHAIRVAQHMDKNKDLAQADNYTLDEVHDRLIEDEVRAKLIQKGLLKEL